MISPNLKKITLEPRSLGDLSPAVLVDSPVQFLWELQTLQPLFHFLPLHILREKLEDITISTQSSCFKGIHMPNLSFREFSKLKRLRVPFQVFMSQNIQTTSPEDVLPRNLQFLEVHKCNRLVFEWMTKLLSYLYNHPLPKLRQLDLYFPHCLRSSVNITCYGKDTRRLRELLQGMVSEHGCKTTVYARPRPMAKYEAGDLLSELDVYDLLTPEEAWLAATKDEQLSDVVARSSSGVSRARTKLERKLFLRNPHMPTTLFSSPTFNGAAWEKVVFFKGTKGTKLEFEKKKDSKESGKGSKVGKDAKSPRSPGHQDKRRGSGPKLAISVQDLGV